MPHTQGLSNQTGWNCAASGGGGEGVLSFRDRWNGAWRIQSNNDFTGLTWAACENNWHFGYLNTPNNRPTNVAVAPRFSLSTLPLMR